MVAQMSNQDPLKPMDDTQFVAQLAQFSGLEQQMQTNTLLQQLATAQQGITNASNAGLVGKTVTVQGSTVSLDGQGLGSQVSFSLAQAAQSVKVSITDSGGNVVRTLNLGSKSGNVSEMWDGKNDSGTQQPAGSYTVSVDAKTTAGASVSVSQETTGLVTAVSYTGGYSSLVLDTGITAPTSNLIRVNATTQAK
ncbi:MAG: FlgD immunoglobulin-like domain containing protein [Myxococcales bacterium]